MCEQKREPIFILVLCAVFLLMLAFNLLSPLVADDYMYAFSFATGERIDSVGDIFPSMAAHAVVMNGRVIPDFFVQLFTMMPKQVFSVLNALVYVAFLMGLYWLVCEEKRYDVRLVCMLAGALFLLIPAFGQVNLWMTAAINYLWRDTIMLYLLIPFADALFRKRDRPNVLTQVMMAVAAFAMGNTTENVSAAAALLMGLCIGWLLIRKRPVRIWMFTTTGMAIAGWLFMMLSPANRGNVDQVLTGLGALMDQFGSAMDMFMKHGLWLSLAYIVLFCFAWRAGVDWDRAALSAGLFVCGLLANFAMTAAHYYPERAFAGTTIMLIAACALLIVALPRSAKPLVDALTLCLTFTMALTALGALPNSYNRYRQAQARVLEVCAQRDAGIMDVTTYGVAGRSKYDVFSGLNELTNDANYFPNVYYARYYGLNSVVIDRME